MARDADRHAMSVSEAFERCPGCGTFVVQLATHRCPPDEPPGPLTRERREALAAADEREDAAPVGVFQRSRGDAYAYHELDGGDPLCGRAGVTKATGVAVVTRAEAKARGKSPCGSCRRVEDRRRVGEG